MQETARYARWSRPPATTGSQVSFFSSGRSSARPRTVCDSVSPTAMTEQLEEERWHCAADRQTSCSSVRSSGLSIVGTAEREVSTQITHRMSSVSAGDVAATEESASSTMLSLTVSGGDEDGTSGTVSEGVAIVPEHSATQRQTDLDLSVLSNSRDNPGTVSVVPELLVERSESSAAVVWLLDSSAAASTALNSDRGHRCSHDMMIEMTDLCRHHGPPSAIHRPPYRTTARPPSVTQCLSSRPDIFYTGSCLQVRL